MINVEVSAINSRDGHFWNIKIHRPLQGLNPAGQPISTFTANEGVGLNVRHKQKATKIVIRQTNELFSFLTMEFTTCQCQ